MPSAAATISVQDPHHVAGAFRSQAGWPPWYGVPLKYQLSKMKGA
jgi:hypothetical protein